MAITAAGRKQLLPFSWVFLSPKWRSPDYLEKFVESEIEKWAAVIKAANIKAD
jgi:tripartite-type tricarboxylate transporter receptor subunit TctC